MPEGLGIILSGVQEGKRLFPRTDAETKRKEKNIMKRRFKRIASLVLAMVMVFAMAMPAMATVDNVTTPPGGFTLTIGNESAGHTYEAYQIFSGTLAEDSGIESETGANYILSDIEWGASVNTTGAEFASKIATALGQDPASFNGADAKAVAEKLSGLDFNSSVARAFAEAIAEFLKPSDPAPKTSGAYDADAKNYTISGLDPGYYLVKDQDGGSDDAYTAFMLEVVGNAQAKAKSDAPEVEKKVMDVNDSTNETTSWQDSADYDIGDRVPFQLTGTVASNYDLYKAYYFEFTDTLSAGLTFDELSDLKVTIRGTEVTKLEDGNTTGTNGYILKTTANGNGTTTIQIIFNNLKDITPTVSEGTEIVVTYNARLNENAKMGNPGNLNEVHLVYSNNPNDDYNGTGKPDTGETPDDVVIVFTFDVDIDKIDSAGPLAGAAFTLKKYDPESTDPVPDANGWITVHAFTAGEATNFNFEGVDDGIYCLEETTTPDGYNSIDPIYFEIKATHSTEGNSETEITVTELTATSGTWTKEDGFKAYEAGSKQLTFTINTGGPTGPTEDPNKYGVNGQAAADIENQKGATLPETGGIGTTIFYVVGSVLVLGAVILLVTKRRMKG